MDKTEYGAAVLHDFFVDRLVFSKDFGGLIRSIESKRREGGGGIHGIAQEEIRGGNAVNLAHALARLGTRTYLVTHSDAAREPLLRGSFAGLPATLSVKPLEPGLTVAFESRTPRGDFNVMLGHSGGAGSFDSSLLSAEDWRALERSKVVCSVNWAANSKGTELVSTLRKKLGTRLIFVDPADFRDRLESFRAFCALVKNRHILDWLSLNEFEARTTARLLGIGKHGLKEVCRKLAAELSVKLDVHTERGSFSSDGAEVVSHRADWITPTRLTGAGDVWDAASLHFFLKGKGDLERIQLSDTAAGIYLRSGDPVGPTEAEVVSLFEHS